MSTGSTFNLGVLNICQQEARQYKERKATFQKITLGDSEWISFGCRETKSGQSSHKMRYETNHISKQMQGHCSDAKLAPAFFFLF